MNKLEYGSLYKFCVSFGLILFFLPFIGMFSLINLEPTIISQEKLKGLSSYSLHAVERKKIILDFCFDNLFQVGIVFIITGILLIVIGGYNWAKKQFKEDAMQEVEKVKKELELKQMSLSEKMRKVVEENEMESSSEEPDLNKTKKQDNKNQKTESNASEQNFSHKNEQKFKESPLFKHIEIEDRYFKYLRTNFPLFYRRHSLYRNIRIGNHEYDAIAISTETNTDIIYEIKYWERVPLLLLVTRVFENLKIMMNNYKQLQQRDCKITLVIVSPQNVIDKLRDRVNGMAQTPNWNFPVAIEYIPKESLPQL